MRHSRQEIITNISYIASWYVCASNFQAYIRGLSFSKNNILGNRLVFLGNTHIYSSIRNSWLVLFAIQQLPKWIPKIGWFRVRHHGLTKTNFFSTNLVHYMAVIFTNEEIIVLLYLAALCKRLYYRLGICMFTIGYSLFCLVLSDIEEIEPDLLLLLQYLRS